jgi:hypothetical protein
MYCEFYRPIPYDHVGVAAVLHHIEESGSGQAGEAGEAGEAPSATKQSLLCVERQRWITVGGQCPRDTYHKKHQHLTALIRHAQDLVGAVLVVVELQIRV